MSKDSMSWVDQQEERIQKERNEGYFSIKEGDNRIQLLSHCVPLPQVWNNATKRYDIAQEGNKNISIKGLCWVLHDGLIKQAKLPYTVVKQLRALQNDPDWEFDDFPMPRTINIRAKGAKTKEVEYTVIPSPKETPVAQAILDELAQKPMPEELLEIIKSKVASPPIAQSDEDEEINPEAIPF